MGVSVPSTRFLFGAGFKLKIMLETGWRMKGFSSPPQVSDHAFLEGLLWCSGAFPSVFSLSQQLLCGLAKPCVWHKLPLGR